MIAVEPYRTQRLTAFLHPSDVTVAAGYQLHEAQLAFGTGGFFGVGLGQSVTKLSYLPEAHTDMIVPIVGEELGVIGVFGLLIAFGLLAWCGYSVALRAKDPFGKLLAAGLTTLIVGTGAAQHRRDARRAAVHGRARAADLLRRHQPDRDARGDRPRALGGHARRPGAAGRGAGAQEVAQARARRRAAARPQAAARPAQAGAARARRRRAM